MPKKPPEEGQPGYVIGYGRPPIGSRFQRGEKSPNPAGRPPGSRSVGAAVAKTLGRDVTMVVDGHRKRVSITEAVVLKLVQRALNNDHKAAIEIMRLAQALQADAQHGAADQPLEKTDEEKKQIAQYVDAIQITQRLIEVGAFELSPTGRVKICPWLLEATAPHLTDANGRYAFQVLNQRHMSGSPDY